MVAKYEILHDQEYKFKGRTIILLSFKVGRRWLSHDFQHYDVTSTCETKSLNSLAITIFPKALNKFLKYIRALNLSNY